jgi:hypothetical protein
MLTSLDNEKEKARRDKENKEKLLSLTPTLNPTVFMTSPNPSLQRYILKS